MDTGGEQKTGFDSIWARRWCLQEIDLAWSFDDSATAVSMTPRGTPGYSTPRRGSHSAIERSQMRQSPSLQATRVLSAGPSGDPLPGTVEDMIMLTLGMMGIDDNEPGLNNKVKTAARSKRSPHLSSHSSHSDSRGCTDHRHRHELANQLQQAVPHLSAAVAQHSAPLCLSTPPPAMPGCTRPRPGGQYRGQWWGASRSIR